jgi:acetyl-CoA acetyltransferase
VVVDAVRTPVGKRNGSLAGIHAVDLSAHVLAALAARNGLDPAVVDDVIWGCVQQVGQQAGDVGGTLSTDEGLRRGTTPELAGLKPAFKERGFIHAGNSSQISDGAAALLMMTSDKARELGGTSLRVSAETRSDCQPHGTGPIRSHLLPAMSRNTATRP